MAWHALIGAMASSALVSASADTPPGAELFRFTLDDRHG